MPILFLDENDKPLWVVSGKLDDPDKYEDERLPEKWKWKEVTEEDAQIIFPKKDTGGKRMDGPVTEYDMDIFVSVLEKELKMPKDSLSQKINSEKMKR